MRSDSRLGVVVAALVLAVLGLGLEVSSASADGLLAPMPTVVPPALGAPPPADPAPGGAGQARFAQQAVAAAVLREQMRSDPAERNRRRLSRRVFRGLTRGQALDTARIQLGEVVNAAPWTGVKLDEGQHITRYTGARTAVVSGGPHKPKMLLDSTFHCG